MCRGAFDALDIDKNGYISKHELQLGLLLFYINTAPNLEAANQSIDLVFAAMDADGDGQITFDEFLAVTSKRMRQSDGL
jgi:Ca2+-binding EF-hand superfamily protein